MARIFSYDYVIKGKPAPVPDIVRLAQQISDLAPLHEGYAVVVGSAAWGTVTVGSDIDLVAFRSERSAGLEEDIENVRENYASTKNHGHSPPPIDIIWIGAESDQLIERDNIVSKSAPIAENRIVSEIFERTCARLIDHLRAIADVKGDPWRTFVERYFQDVSDNSDLRKDILNENGNRMIAKWRQQDWNSDTLSGEEIETINDIQDFAFHAGRLILSEKRLYPRPDRRSDILTAIEELPEPDATNFLHALGPAFSIGGTCARLIEQVASNSGVMSLEEYHASILSEARIIDIDEIEAFIWAQVR